MTENEIIKNIEQHGFISDEVKDAAINAIKEIQRIKTVIDDFALECGGAVSSVLEMSYQLRKYLIIGTIEELQALKEKAEPNGRAWVVDNDSVICPHCGHGMDKKHFPTVLNEPVYHYCPFCGRKVIDRWE